MLMPTRHWPNGYGLSPPADDLLERADHALGWPRKVNRNAQCLAVEVVDYVEHANAAPIGKLVIYEVHRSYLVHVGRRGQSLMRLPNCNPPADASNAMLRERLRLAITSAFSKSGAQLVATIQ